MAMGWRGSHRHWQHYEKGYLLLAALATPLVFSVSGVLGLDFSVSQLPGWHATLFPPYFVVGAVFCGFAFVVLLLMMVRRLLCLNALITVKHLDAMGKFILGFSLMMAYIYAFEIFSAWYSGNPYEHYTFINRAVGPYSWVFWLMLVGNIVVPQMLWSGRIRRHMGAVAVICLFITVGMWCERFVIIVTSIQRDYLPSSWGIYVPTGVDIGTFLGTFGLFFFLFLLFVRYVPVVSVFEVKAALASQSTDVS